MTLVEFIATLRKRIAYVLIPFLLLAGLAFGISKSMTPMYTAEASVYFSLPVGQSGADLYQGSNYTQQQIGSFALLVRQPIVMDPVVRSLGLETTGQELAHSVTAKSNADTVIIEISATDKDPGQAAAIANAVTAQFIKVVRDLSPELPNGQASIKAVTTASATVPVGVSSPNTKKNVLVGGILGLFIGLLSALAREKFDNRVRVESDFPHGVHLLTSIEEDKSFRVGVMAVPGAGTRREMVREESYRKLRTGLRFLDIENPAKVIVMTSSVAAEGKSSSAINLARVLGGDGQRVLLVDGDLRRPKVADYVGLEGAVGLVDVLAGTVDVGVAIQSWMPGEVDLLPSGTLPPNPSEVLGSDAMSELVTSLRDQYDYVVIDAPPLLPVTDASVASTLADGAVLIVRYGKTTRQQMRTAVDSLRSVNARVLGVIINREPSPKPWRRQSLYYYGATTTPSAQDVPWPQGPEQRGSEAATTDSTTVEKSG